TETIRAGGKNLLAVRVLNPTNEPIDGIVLGETPHRNKVIPYRAGASYNHGGIVDSVELLIVPVVRIEDVFARPDTATGKIRVQAQVRNAGQRETTAQLEFAVAPAASGETLQRVVLDRKLPPGDTLVEAELSVVGARRWELNDPFLYRVTVRAGDDERSVRCGFRDFTFENGAFRLNGRRLFLRCSHTGNHCPVGLQLPPDPDMLRRDLLNVKVMGFNSIRFIAGVATRYQLDLCDEIGLMVYEEPYAAWCLRASPKMAERFDESLFGMVRRDRNHPSIVMWGLLNETHDGPVFRHAAAALPRLRELDDTRMVMLNSGRWDLNRRGAADPPELAGLQLWRADFGADPNVSHNPTARPIVGSGIKWAPGQLALHPGPSGEYSVVRWTCPASGEHEVNATFTGVAGRATTDVHVLHNGKPLHDGGINIGDHGNSSSFVRKLVLNAGDRLDFVVGFGNGHYGGDTTALAVTIRRPDGTLDDAAAGFTLQKNPNGAWSYGSLAAGAQPDVTTFKVYTTAHQTGAPRPPEKQVFGTLSNPGTREWQDVLDDQHPYQRVPHTASVIKTLRTFKGDKNPMFVSEYGVGSAVDLWRVTRHYERLGATHAEDAQFYRDKLDRFLADWERWKMAECFATPQEFFAQSIRQMAAERLYGMNALRANPALVAYSLTGTVDQGMSGEGLFTTFRELKPGTTDAMFEVLAPLRLCLFAGPEHVYRGARVRCEAVLANEDALTPGEYPVR
ncbi:MAG: glycoside hydrolase family 2, partial [Verrucomicrobia bacterium]|nr:glycoside hydrolase family 2 [Verrucomicrobiota bacterium]